MVTEMKESIFCAIIHKNAFKVVKGTLPPWQSQFAPQMWLYALDITSLIYNHILVLTSTLASDSQHRWSQLNRGPMQHQVPYVMTIQVTISGFAGYGKKSWGETQAGIYIAIDQIFCMGWLTLLHVVISILSLYMQSEMKPVAV